MFTYSLYNRLKRYIRRHWFRIMFSGSFAYFGKRAVIIDPDIIEGEQYISIEDGASLNTKAWLLALKINDTSPRLLIKKGATIGRFAHIVAVQEIVIGDNVLIADKVYISDNLHVYKEITRPVLDQDIIFKGKVEIGEGSWIGENVSIIGACVGKHCIIGANSVVTHDIPDYSVAVGIPAKVIKRYNFQTQTWITNDSE